MKKKTRIIVTASVVVFIVVIAVFITAYDTTMEQETPPLTADTTGLEKEIPIIGKRMTAGQFQEVLTATGVIEAWHRVYISSESGGRVVEWMAEIGRRLNRGDVIVRLDDKVAELSLRQAEAELEVTRIAAAKSNQDYERLQSLFEQGDLSENQLEEAELNRRNGEARLKAAEAMVGLVRRSWEEMHVKMPFRGYLSARMVEVGQSIAPGTPVAEVVQANPIRLSVGLSEQDILRVRVGQSVIVRTVGWGGREFSGRIYAVGAAADASSRLFPVEVRLSNPELDLKPGMAATVEIIVAEYPEAIVIPLDAVINLGRKSTCFTVESGRAHRRDIQLGESRGDSVMVVSGIGVGDTLVVIGQDGLKPGQRITLTMR